MINPTGQASALFSAELSNAAGREPGASPMDKALQEMEYAFEETIAKQIMTSADTNHDGILDPQERAAAGFSQEDIRLLDRVEARSKYIER